MNLQLKAIQYSEFASQETNCYAANLYLDGKKVASVGNAGHGGGDFFHGDFKLLNQIGEENLEDFCAVQLERFIARKQLKSLMKNHVVTERGGEFYQTKSGFSHPEGTTILNDLPFEEALDLFIKDGA
jgi:hypothetical protein